MKLPRPHIPYRIRVIVAARQCVEHGWTIYPEEGDSYSAQLKKLLKLLFGDQRWHLDHDPPLMSREQVTQQYYDAGTRALKYRNFYRPDANDPDHLIYRTVEDHRIKTFVRGDGATRSDISQQRYLKRVAKNRKPKHTFKPRKAKQVRRVRHAVVP